MQVLHYHPSISGLSSRNDRCLSQLSSNRYGVYLRQHYDNTQRFSGNYPVSYLLKGFPKLIVGKTLFLTAAAAILVAFTPNANYPETLPQGQTTVSTQKSKQPKVQNQPAPDTLGSQLTQAYESLKTFLSSSPSPTPKLNNKPEEAVTDGKKKTKSLTKPEEEGLGEILWKDTKKWIIKQLSDDPPNKVRKKARRKLPAPPPNKPETEEP